MGEDASANDSSQATCEFCGRSGAKKMGFGSFCSEQCQEAYGRKLFEQEVVPDVLRRGRNITRMR